MQIQDTILGFKDKIDLPEWRPLQSTLSNSAAGACSAFDLRNDIEVANPYIWFMQALTTLNRYNVANDAWSEINAFTAVGGTLAAGAFCIFVPSHGISGTVGGTPTTTSFQLATLQNSASALLNQFANSGNNYGYKIRVIGNGAGGSGKIEERFIIANTSGTTPIITLNTALTFTPQTTDTYELLAGRIYILGSGTTAAGFWKALDVATLKISGNLTVTNLPSVIGTDTSGVMLDEQYVPYNRRPGEGYLGINTYDTGNFNGALQCLTATASAAGTLTGQATGGDAAVVANEYRNFQIRIVEDTGIPTAVGQRRKITSHTAGASPIYTLYSNWTVTPSVTCKYVIEQNNNLLLMTGTNTVTYSYAAGGFLTDASWSTAAASGGATQYANPGFANGAGVCIESAFSIVKDKNGNVKPSFIYHLRGAASVSMEYLDIAAGANGVWATIVPLDMTTVALTTGTCSAHDPSTNEGKYFYIQLNATNRFFRFNMLNQVWEPWATDLPLTQSTAIVGGKIAISLALYGVTKITLLYQIANTSNGFYNCLIQR